MTKGIKIKSHFLWILEKKRVLNLFSQSAQTSNKTKVKRKTFLFNCPLHILIEYSHLAFFKCRSLFFGLRLKRKPCRRFPLLCCFNSSLLSTWKEHAFFLQHCRFFFSFFVFCLSDPKKCAFVCADRTSRCVYVPRYMNTSSTLCMRIILQTETCRFISIKSKRRR